MTDLQQTVRDTVRYMTKHYIGETPRHIYTMKTLPQQLMDDGSIDDVAQCIPVTTTLTLLNSIQGNNTLIEGGIGTGKTMLSACVASMLYQMPFEFNMGRRVVGTPGATINEILATHDLAELMKGENTAFMYLPFYSPCLLIDELNRFSELEQNRLRDGIATGEWKYSGSHTWVIPHQVVISAQNPDAYLGTFGVNENLMDNYSILLFPAEADPVANSEQILNGEARMREELGLEDEYMKTVLDYMQNKNDEEAVKKAVEALQAKTAAAYKNRGIPIIHNGTIANIREAIADMELDAEAHLFKNGVTAEVLYSKQFGRLRLEDPASDEDHDKPYLAARLQMPFSGRFMQSWEKCGKAIAWYTGKEEVGAEEMKTAFVFAAAGRLSPQEEFLQEVQNGRRVLDMRHQLPMALIEKGWENFSDFKGDADKPSKGFEAARHAINIYLGNEDGTIQDSIKLLRGCDHPLATSVLTAIAQEIYDEQFGDE